MVDKGPCPGEEAMYRCTVSGGDLEWQWTPVGSRERDYIVLSLLPPQSRLTTLEIGATEVIFNVTEFSSSNISVIATVSNPELLNGTVMSCGGQSFTINVPGRSLVPTALRVSRESSSTSELIIQPFINENARNIFYQTSPSNMFTTWTSPITLTAPNNIVFFQCQYNSTFNLGVCILNDNNEDTNYTLYSNGTWTISRDCSPSKIQVTCEDEGIWSENIDCQALTTLQTDSEFQKVTTNAEIFQMQCPQHCSQQCPQQCPTCHTSYSLELIIGGIIGSFVLALTLGLVLGLLFGVKFTRTYNAKQVNTSMKNIDLNKGPLYDEIEIDKNVELTQNISYETVKNIK